MIRKSFPTTWELNTQGIREIPDLLINIKIPSRSKKAGKFEILLGFARSHFIVTRG